MGFWGRILGGVDQYRQIRRSVGRSSVRLSDNTEMSVQRLAETRGAKDVLYSWPTRLDAHELLGRCIPFREKGGFAAQVEVVIFPLEGAKQQQGHRVVSAEEYFENGEAFDSQAAAVRFNAASRLLGDFSVIWTRRAEPQREVRGQVEAIFDRTPEMMREMIARSVTSEGVPFVDRIMQEAPI